MWYNRLRQRRHIVKSEETVTLKIHVGCGPRPILGPGWVNVDQDPYPGITVCDARRLSAHFLPNSASLIYASHVVEYFDEHEVLDVLRDWHAVLSPGGVLRLAVPDLEALIALYARTRSIANVVGPLYGRLQHKDGSLIFHKMAYDYPTLAFVLRMAGYRAIRRWHIEDTCHADHDDGSQAYYPHMDKENGLLLSLNVEGTK